MSRILVVLVVVSVTVPVERLVSQFTCNVLMASGVDLS